MQLPLLTRIIAFTISLDQGVFQRVVGQFSISHWLGLLLLLSLRSSAKLIEHIREVFADHQARYGSPRIRLELHRRGIVCGKNRVARLMREAGLRARCPRRKVPRTTHSDHDGPIAPNRLKTLEVKAPHQVWAMDIAYLRCGDRWAYLAAVLGLYLHKIVGWEISERIDSELVHAALRHAVGRQRNPESMLVHSDRGSQFASAEFIALVESLGYDRSRSARGNRYDHAVIESFFGVLKREDLDEWGDEKPRRAPIPSLRLH